MFQRATKRQARLRLALIGPAGSGKTYTALNIATAMGGRIALLDTERGSASKYSDLCTFDSCEPENHHPQRYIDAIAAAEQAGYDILIIDSLSHAWNGRDGALELVDKVAKRQQTNNTFGAWRDVTPLHNALIDAMVECPILINRPIVIGPKGTRLCRPSEEVLKLLDQPLPADFTKEDGEVVQANG